MSSNKESTDEVTAIIPNGTKDIDDIKGVSQDIKTSKEKEITIESKKNGSDINTDFKKISENGDIIVNEATVSESSVNFDSDNKLNKINGTKDTDNIITDNKNEGETNEVETTVSNGETLGEDLANEVEFTEKLYNFAIWVLTEAVVEEDTDTKIFTPYEESTHSIISKREKQKLNIKALNDDEKKLLKFQIRRQKEKRAKGGQYDKTLVDYYERNFKLFVTDSCSEELGEDDNDKDKPLMLVENGHERPVPAYIQNMLNSILKLRSPDDLLVHTISQQLQTITNEADYR